MEVSHFQKHEQILLCQIAKVSSRSTRGSLNQVKNGNETLQNFVKQFCGNSMSRNKRKLKHTLVAFAQAAGPSIPYTTLVQVLPTWMFVFLLECGLIDCDSDDDIEEFCKKFCQNFPGETYLSERVLL